MVLFSINRIISSSCNVLIFNSKMRTSMVSTFIFFPERRKPMESININQCFQRHDQCLFTVLFVSYFQHLIATSMKYVGIDQLDLVAVTSETG